MTIKTLARMPYAQAKIYRYDDGSVALVSYTTCVATINNEGWLSVRGLYSNTTRRHLSAFAAECCGTDYYTLKKCYYCHLQYNIYTKEFYNIHTGEVWTA